MLRLRILLFFVFSIFGAEATHELMLRGSHAHFPFFFKVSELLTNSC